MGKNVYITKKICAKVAKGVQISQLHTMQVSHDIYNCSGIWQVSKLMAAGSLLAQASSPVRFTGHSYLVSPSGLLRQRDSWCQSGHRSAIPVYVILSYSGNVKDLLSFCQLLLAFFLFCLTCLLLNHLAFECLQIFPVDCVKDRSLFSDKSFRLKVFITCDACGIKLEQIILDFQGHEFLWYNVMKGLRIILALLCERCHGLSCSLM